MKLYTYCLRNDTGAAPNPYGDLCTLALSKPVMRRRVEVGDWVAGLASPESKLKDASRRLVYAMKVSQKMTMQEYDQFCIQEQHIKLPARPAQSYEDFVGDCIYEFDPAGKPILRASVHDERNLDLDLGGQYVLMAEKFYYFGVQAPELPQSLWKIIKKGVGFQDKKNTPFIGEFETFLGNYQAGHLYGTPINKIENWYGAESRGQCAETDYADDQEDERLMGRA